MNIFKSNQCIAKSVVWKCWGEFSNKIHFADSRARCCSNKIHTPFIYSMPPSSSFFWSKWHLENVHVETARRTRLDNKQNKYDCQLKSTVYYSSQHTAQLSIKYQNCTFFNNFDTYSKHIQMCAKTSPRTEAW